MKSVKPFLGNSKKLLIIKFNVYFNILKIGYFGKVWKKAPSGGVPKFLAT